MDERVSIITPDHIELDFEPAGLGSRLLASLVDIAAILGIFLVILIGSVLAGVTTAGLVGAMIPSRLCCPCAAAAPARAPRPVRT